MIHRAFKFFSSLWLTVVLLSLALILVFIGTMAQVKLGLYVAQFEYFRSLFIYWKPGDGSFKIPVFPGGWLLGGLLLLNLIAAHLKRFQLTKKKIGIFLIHAGLIFLLLGQFFTEVFQVESNLRLEEGETRNYSESALKHEVAVIDVSNPDRDDVVAIPESIIANREDIRHPQLPFTIRVKEYFENSRPMTQVKADADFLARAKKMQASGSDAQVVQVPIVATMDEKNVPSALLELVSEKGTVGEYIASLWQNAPHSFEFEGKSYHLILRPIRYYRPYTITLIEFRHDVYPGTTRPKNFSSKVLLKDPTRGEEREVLIKMNEPLRYAGETYFQASFEQGRDDVTILQVVRNPAAITPYVACTLMGLGLLVQFLMHLVAFGRKAKTKDMAVPTQTTSRATASLAGEGRAS